MGRGGNIVRELADDGRCVFRGGSLLGAVDTEGNDELVVHIACILEEGANDALDPFDDKTILSGGLESASETSWTFELYAISVCLCEESWRFLWGVWW